MRVPGGPEAPKSFTIGVPGGPEAPNSCRIEVPRGSRGSKIVQMVAWRPFALLMHRSRQPFWAPRGRPRDLWRASWPATGRFWGDVGGPRQVQKNNFFDLKWKSAKWQNCCFSFGFYVGKLANIAERSFSKLF